ncbi:Hypothetical protein POVR1_LOCUS152 [uncultured virus]|nr:Hypothetical protein POVR1_LOCUS152 [uncultured virus]
MELLNFLNEDCIVEIIRQVLQPKDFWSICCTCKILSKIPERYRSSMDFYFNYRLNPDQVITLQKVMNSASPNIYVNLPMSSGKTALALICCLERVKAFQGSALYLVTQKVFETAKLEVEKLTRGRTMTIPITFYDAKNHRKFDYHRSQVIVATRNCKSVFRARDLHTIAIDEAHTGSLWSIAGNFPQTPIKLILFSAASPTFNAKGELSNLYRPVEVIGHLSTQEMSLPQVVSHFYCSDPHTNFYREPKRNYIDLAEELTVGHTKGSTMGTALLLELLTEEVKGKTLILRHETVGSHVFWFNHQQTIQEGTAFLETLGLRFVRTLREIEDSSDQAVVGGMNSFSEGVNLPMFENLILLCGYSTHERLRQCVGRLVRTTSHYKKINVYYLCESLSTPMLSSIPRELVETYRKYVGTLSITPSSRNAYVNGMSDEEKLVMSVKHQSKMIDKVLDWIYDRSGFVAFTRLQFEQIIKRRIS